MNKSTEKKVNGSLMATIEKGFKRQEKIFDKKLDKFAIMVAKGFEGVDKRFDEVDERFEQVDQRFEQVDQRFEQVDRRFEQVDRRFANIEATLGSMHRDIEEIQREMTYKDEMEDLMARVKYLEIKLGIESGK